VHDRRLWLLANLQPHRGYLYLPEWQLFLDEDRLWGNGCSTRWPRSLRQHNLRRGRVLLQSPVQHVRPDRLRLRPKTWMATAAPRSQQVIP